MSAAEGGSVVTAGLLIHNGCNLEIREKQRGGTALTAASFAGRPKMITFLLKQGADPNVGDRTGRTPLMVASCKGNASTVERILDLAGGGPLGANPPGVRRVVVDKPDKLGCTPLMIAAQQGRIDIMKLLLDDSLVETPAEVEHKDSAGRTAIMYAAEARKLEAVNWLVELGATFTNRSKHGKAVEDHLRGTLEELVIGNPRKLGIQIFPEYPPDNARISRF